MKPADLALQNEIIHRKILTSQQLEEVHHYEEEQKVPFGEALLHLGLLEELQLLKLRASTMGITFLDVENLSPEPELVVMVPQDMASSKVLIPIEKKNNTTIVSHGKPHGYGHGGPSPGHPAGAG